MNAVIAAPLALEPPVCSFFGRSLNDYTRCFALNCDGLRGQAVLDVAAGASSFVAEACRRGADAVAVDPLYGASAVELTNRIRMDHDGLLARVRENARRPKATVRNGRARSGWPRASVTGSGRKEVFAPFAEADLEWRAAAQRFLADYEAHLVHGRYVRASLPQLPFLDRAFDLVLCANLSFTLAEDLDFGWHVAACRELVRVSAGEVRIFPSFGFAGRCAPELGRLRRELLLCGVRSASVPVTADPLTGARSMLVLNPEEPV